MQSSSCTLPTVLYMLYIPLHRILLHRYVADSESSAVRVVDLKSGGSGLKAGGDPLFSDNLFRWAGAGGGGSGGCM